MRYRLGQRVFADLRNGRPRVVGLITGHSRAYPYEITDERTGAPELVLEDEIVSDLPLSMEPADVDEWLDS